MTSSTPSPSAQELADWIADIERCAAIAKSVGNDTFKVGVTTGYRIADALRRLSEIERERDEARQQLIFHGEVVELAKETMAKLIAAEAERDALREMLRQADAVIDALTETAHVPLPPPVAQWRKKSISRHLKNKKENPT